MYDVQIKLVRDRTDSIMLRSLQEVQVVQYFQVVLGHRWFRQLHQDQPLPLHQAFQHHPIIHVDQRKGTIHITIKLRNYYDTVKEAQCMWKNFQLSKEENTEMHKCQLFSGGSDHNTCTCIYWQHSTSYIYLFLIKKFQYTQCILTVEYCTVENFLLDKFFPQPSYYLCIVEVFSGANFHPCGK